MVNKQTDKIFVGGIAASLMHDRFVREKEWRGIRFIKGRLGERADRYFEGRFKEEFGYKSVKSWPIYESAEGGNVMYYME